MFHLILKTISCSCRAHKTHALNNTYNWNGDEIVRDTVISKKRFSPGGKPMDSDIRSFVQYQNNNVLEDALDKLKTNLSVKHAERFAEKKLGDFDLRAQILSEYIARGIKYSVRESTKTKWLMPDEILTDKVGDCEERAHLLAALMLASGISNFVTRVAQGKIHTASGTYSHAWVVYKNEHGVWQVLDPGARGNIQYVPYFVYNDVHLWRVNHSRNQSDFHKYMSARRFWNQFEPAFGVGTHKGIVQMALKGLEKKFYEKLTDEMKSDLFYLKNIRNLTPQDYVDAFASKVAWMDVNLYEPLLHYDNALIEESYEAMMANVKSGTLSGLAKAFHAIADFYSHTSYAHFAKRSGEGIVPMVTVDPKDSRYAAQFETLPNYSSGDFDFSRFTVNPHLYKGSVDDAVAHWNERLVSGRFGQRNDSGGTLEKTQFLAEKYYKDTYLGALPHHNEIAVDEEDRGSEHRLYNKSNYAQQFEWRKKAAAESSRVLFETWRVK